MHLKPVGERTPPAYVSQGGVMNVEAQGRLVGLVEIELDDCAIGDDFVNRNFGRSYVKSFAGAEGWDDYMQAFGVDAADALGKQSEVGTADREFFDGDQGLRRRCVVIENETFHNATG